MANRTMGFIQVVVAAISIAVLSGLTFAQKGVESTTGAPLKGVDVKLGKNPGGSPAARTTNNDGKIRFGVLEKGSYYLVVVVAEKDANAATDDDVYVVKISGASGGPAEWAWRVKKHDASMGAIPNLKARTTKTSTIQYPITFRSESVTSSFSSTGH